MKWLIYKNINGGINNEFLILINNIYSVVMVQYSNGTLQTQIVLTETLKNYHLDLYDYKEISEIEALILDINSQITKYKKNLKKKLLKTNKTLEYRKELKEIREYLKKIEENSACGEILEEK